MKERYTGRIEEVSTYLSGIEIRARARLPGSGAGTFTRDRKMPLKDLILCCLAKKGLTTVFELRQYFQQRNRGRKMSKQGYLQQRKRLNPDVFSFLNDKYLINFYDSGEAELWNGYLLLAIDGSKAEVPNSQENREHFGTAANQHTKEGQVRAMVSGLYDILNGFYLDIEIGHIRGSESELAKRNLMHLKENGDQAAGPGDLRQGLSFVGSDRLSGERGISIYFSVGVE